MIVTGLGSCTSQNGEAVPNEKLDETETKIFDLSYKQLDNVQSPIDLQSSLAKTHFHHLKAKVNSKLTALLRKSHTVELKIEGGEIESDYHTYVFKQLHFHTPAEHSIDKIKHPMEMHLVSVKIDSLEPDLPKYLVVGITFNEGKANPFIQSIIDNTPLVDPNEFESEEGDSNHNLSVFSDLSAHPIDLNTLFGDKIEDHLKSMYHYKGSLTTYPYTESVEWYVLKETVEVSKEQIEKMNAFMGDNSRITQEKTHLQ